MSLKRDLKLKSRTKSKNKAIETARVSLVGYMKSINAHELYMALPGYIRSTWLQCRDHEVAIVAPGVPSTVYKDLADWLQSPLTLDFTIADYIRIIPLFVANAKHHLNQDKAIQELNEVLRPIDIHTQKRLSAHVLRINLSGSIDNTRYLSRWRFIDAGIKSRLTINIKPVSPTIIRKYLDGKLYKLSQLNTLVDLDITEFGSLKIVNSRLDNPKPMLVDPTRFGQSGAPLSVLCTSHSLRRVAERLDVPELQNLMSPILYSSFIKPEPIRYAVNEWLIPVVARPPISPGIIACLGYLFVEIIDGSIIVRTFKFATSENMPCNKLYKTLRLTRRDIDYFQMDRMSTLINSDVTMNIVLCDVLQASGLGPLLELAKLFKDTDLPSWGLAEELSTYIDLPSKHRSITSISNRSME